MAPPTASYETPVAGGIRRRLLLRNWRVRWRLVALIVIPTVTAVILGGLRIEAALNTANVYTRVQGLADTGSRITLVAHELENERDLTAGYIASGRQDSELVAVKRQYIAVDAAAQDARNHLTEIDSSYGTIAHGQAVSALNRLNEISSLRGIATEGRLRAEQVTIKYTESIDDLLAFDDSVTQDAGDAALGEMNRALSSLSKQEEQASRQRAIVYAMLRSNDVEPSDLDDLRSAEAQQESEASAYRAIATTEQLRDYLDTVTGRDVDRSQSYLRLAITMAAAGRHVLDIDPAVTDDAAEWYSAMSGTVNRLRAVEDRQVGAIIDQSRTHKDEATRAALLGAAVIAVVLIMVLIVTLVMAQSLVGPLRRLRTGALDVAGARLPDLVRRLRDPEAGHEPLQVEPIDVDTIDEIGEVARSFDEVHREAVRLASNEALMRSNVNSMFVNLSRRSQSLIERQLRLIEDLEQSEQDTGRLDSLFKLDHLATRMRRNCENLLVLGGQEQARRLNEPVPLVDIVRASLSEVERYERVAMRIQDEVSVVGRYVSDLVHLVAELVENATSFSPEHTKVAVSGHLLSGGGAMLQVSDNGVGMSPEDLEGANWRLANPPTIDVSVSRRMGLFVVGRLAQRHGIRVELRAALSGGLTAFVILPANAIVQDPNTFTQPPGPEPELNRSHETPMKLEPAPVPETPREPVRPAPLPKRKSAATSPPGRGSAPTAPARSAPSASPLRAPSPPQPATKSPRAPSTPTRPPAAGSVLSDNRSRDQKSGRSPIFEAMQSEWFQRRSMDGPMSRSEPHPEWSSPGDDGWRAAESVREPAVGGQTTAGLPKRVPGTNRIPGSVGSQPAAEQPPPARPHVAPEADAVRNRFASFQKGVRRGRAAIRPEDDERETQ
jgi:signal transduction histidine kinase